MLPALEFAVAGGVYSACREWRSRSMLGACKWWCFLVLPALGLIVISERMILGRRAWTRIALLRCRRDRDHTGLVHDRMAGYRQPLVLPSVISAADWVASESGWHNYWSLITPPPSWIRGAATCRAGSVCSWRQPSYSSQEAVRRQVKPDTWILCASPYSSPCSSWSPTCSWMPASRLQLLYYFWHLSMESQRFIAPWHGVNARLIRSGQRENDHSPGQGWIVSLWYAAAAGGEYWGLYSGHPIRLMVAAYVLIAVLLAAFVSDAVTLIGRRNGFVQLLGVVAGVAFVSISCATDMRIEAERLLWQPTDARPDFQTTVDAQRFVETNLVPDRRLLIWYNEKSSQQSELTAISGTFLFGCASAQPFITGPDGCRLAEVGCSGPGRPAFNGSPAYGPSA